MALILDTNALSAFVDGDAKLLRRLGDENELALPAIVLGEYLFGVPQSRYRTEYERWLELNLPYFDMLAVAKDTARHYAEIRRELKAAAHPIPSNDVWIAALAREHNLPVLTRDLHFKAVRGVRVLDW